MASVERAGLTNVLTAVFAEFLVREQYEIPAQNASWHQAYFRAMGEFEDVIMQSRVHKRSPDEPYIQGLAEGLNSARMSGQIASLDDGQHKYLIRTGRVIEFLRDKPHPELKPVAQYICDRIKE